MPASQHLNLTTQQSGTQKGSCVNPQQQPPQLGRVGLSADSIPRKGPARPSAFLKKRKPNLKVRWDNLTVDNEQTPKAPSVRPPTPPLVKRPTGLSENSAYSHPSQISSTSTVEPVRTANSSVKMYSPSVRTQQSAGSRGQNIRAGSAPHPQAYLPSQHLATAASGRTPASVLSTQRSDQASAANSVSKRKTVVATKDYSWELETSSVKDFRHTKMQRSVGTAPRVPPAVPDAPQPRMHGPPPTPRITRLPTPDLPELKTSMFCSCGDTRCNKNTHRKMNEQSKKPSGPSTQQHR
jgi:hypothetical protein